MSAGSEALAVQRRICVAGLETDVARLVLEHGITPIPLQDRARFDSGPDDVAVLPLRQGATVQLGGITVRVERDGASWRRRPPDNFRRGYRFATMVIS